MAKSLTLDAFLEKKEEVKEQLPSPSEKARAEEVLEEAPAEEAEEQPSAAPYAPEAQNLEFAYLVSASYDGKRGKAVLKFYEPKSQKSYLWFDNTGHRPYCYTNLSPEDLECIEKVRTHPGYVSAEVAEKYDPLTDSTVQVTKVIATDPLAIGGKPNSLREVIPKERPDAKVWEADIKYYDCFIYDRQLVPGMPYRIENGKIKPVDWSAPEDALKSLEKVLFDEPAESQEFAKKWIELLEYPVPTYRRVSIDIEVGTDIPTRVPDAREAKYPVIAVAMYSSDGLRRVLVLRSRPEYLPKVEEGDAELEVEPEYFDSEKEMLSEVFEVLRDYPFVITFNGDDFDLRYLVHRAEHFGFSRDELPIELGRDSALLRHGVHVDLYKFFFNRSIQVYAFGQRYRDITLDDIAYALLGVGKVSLEKPVSELSLRELARYCYNDAKITYMLTSFGDDLVMKLITIVARVSKLPMDDVVRQGISNWIRNLMYYEHRQRNWLIPRSEDILQLKGATVTEAVIKGKKYRGAVVVEPVPGVHFNVHVLDFASLYPSIIKRWNLSYETTRCPHEVCKKNLVPDTPHWVCTLRRGISSLIIGSLRDLRVRWYKHRAKDPSLPEDLRNLYNVVQLTLKVFLNASYGVFGAEHFPLYCPPVAESTAAVGRYAIIRTIEKAKSLTIPVIYGDTDSVFLENPPPEKVEELIKWSYEELGMELDVDKVYRYAAFSTRKKNYFGVFPDGSVDIKGLAGKKRNTPEFLKKAFEEMIEILSQVNSPEDFEFAREKIKQIVQTCYNKLKRREYSLDELAITIVLGKSVKEYKKTTPQHVKAALLLPEEKLETLGKGDTIRFVKVTTKDGVKPVEIASIEEIDVDKYVEYLETTFEQVLDALGIDFSEILGYTRLGEFFGKK